MPARTPTALALAVTAALALAGPAMGQESVEWSYEGPTGPEFWGGLSPAFAACGEGSLQSPIDLRDPRRRPVPRIDTDYTPSALAELHNGETIEVRSDLAQTLKVGDESYALAQFHFHVPSEHLVRGDDAPLEIHFVHQAADGERRCSAHWSRRGAETPPSRASPPPSRSTRATTRGWRRRSTWPSCCRPRGAPIATRAR